MRPAVRTVVHRFDNGLSELGDQGCTDPKRVNTLVPRPQRQAGPASRRALPRSPAGGGRTPAVPKTDAVGALQGIGRDGGVHATKGAVA